MPPPFDFDFGKLKFWRKHDANEHDCRDQPDQTQNRDHPSDTRIPSQNIANIRKTRRVATVLNEGGHHGERDEQRVSISDGGVAESMRRGHESTDGCLAAASLGIVDSSPDRIGDIDTAEERARARARGRSFEVSSQTSVMDFAVGGERPNPGGRVQFPR